MPEQNNTAPRKRTFYRIFLPWQQEKEQAWLEKMARKGWQLVSVYIGYTFQQTEPAEMIYRMDYFNKSKKQKNEYLALFQESDWEYVCSSMNEWMYFRIPKEKYTTDLYTDPDSRIEQLKRVEGGSAAIFIIFIVLIDFDKLSFIQPINYAAWAIFLFITAMAILNAISMLAVYLRIQELKKLKEVPELKGHGNHG